MTLAVETLKEQLKNIIAQRDEAQHRYIQCLGAITVLSEQLNLCESQDAAKQEEQKTEELNEGELKDEQVDSEVEGQDC